ncbi:MAG: ferritin-like domain-containing protein [Capsulimonadales bacterium]|nr:ferritin-like domain-containing protein [Capsulimonadales bacterium]
MPQMTGAATGRVTPPLRFSDIPGQGDIKVLNYALALEALEADLYAQALLRLTGGGTNQLGRTIPGLGLNDSAPDVRYVREFGQVEAQHRDFLNGALGGQSILLSALRTARFDFGIETQSRQQVVDLLYTVENLGTQAYLGAIKFFATKTYLLPAGAIQATEARHTAVIAAISNALFGPTKLTAPLAGQTANINGQVNTAGIDSTAEPDAVLATASPFIVL